MNGTGSRLSRVIGSLATRSLIAEASLSPKPGLVTPFSKGAHADMDYALFLSSALALEPCFRACAWAGERAGAGFPLLDSLRLIGREGERAMFRATGGVNTHKGAIFCLGLLSAAVASVRTRRRVHGEGGSLGDAACEWVAGLCSGLVEREMTSVTSREAVTAGERLYREHGVRGARGQAQDGYPVLRQGILPCLRAGLGKGGSGFTHACLDALVLSISELEDSCLLARGGPAGLDAVQAEAARTRRAGDFNTERGLSALRRFDARLCSRGLSPGGSADMVAAGIFLVLAEDHLEGGLELSKRIA